MTRKQARFQLTPKVRLVVEEVPSAYSAALGVFVACGSRHESARLHGLTHLCEHLFFKGTSAKSANEISKISEASGGELNAFTDREYTCFYGSIPVGQMEEAIELLLEVLLDSTLDPGDFEKEKDVVMQEVQGYEDSPDEVFGDLMLEVPWGQHPLARRVAGHSKGVKELKHRDALRFIEEDFLSSEWVISVASSRKVSTVRGLVAKALRKARRHRFGHVLTKRPRRHKLAAPRLPQHPFVRSSVEKYDTEQIQIAFFWPGVPVAHRDEVVWSALVSILGTGSSSRLYKELREDKGLVYTTYAQLLGFADSGLLMGYFAADKKNWLEALSSAGRICRSFADSVDQEEIDYTVRCLEGATYMSYDGIYPRMEAMGRQELYCRRYVTLKHALAELKQVRLEPLRRVARGLHTTPCFHVLGPLGSRQLPLIQRVWEGREKP